MKKFNLRKLFIYSGLIVLQLFYVNCGSGFESANFNNGAFNLDSSRQPATTPDPEKKPPIVTPQPEPEEKPPVVTPKPEPEEKPPVVTPKPEPEEKPPVVTPKPEPEEKPPVVTPKPDGYSFKPIQDLKVFPSAQGYGADTKAGRGGRIIIIKNLNDSGPGSAREALQATGPRQIISNVAGEIKLNSPIYVKSDASYYGQVAPGQGLTFTMNKPEGIEAAIIIQNAKDVLIQYIRVRGVGSGVYRNLIVLNSSNVIVDHGSFSWSTDQNLNSWFVNNKLTFSNNMSYEGLLANKSVAKPTLFGHRGSSGLSIHHNLFAHGLGRMPMLADYKNFDIDRNMIHNPGNWAIEIFNQKETGTVQGNITNNWFQLLQNKNPICKQICTYAPVGRLETYVSGNYIKNDNKNIGFDSNESSGNIGQLNSRISSPQITGVNSSDLPNQLLKHVGASLPARDKNDERIINDVINNSGIYVNDISGNGGASQTHHKIANVNANSLIDLNSVDGVPKAWKQKHGLSESADLTSQDSNNDGYTDWEDWRIDTFENKH